MVTCDGADASHDLVKELDRLAGRHGYQLTWSAAVDEQGQVRERRVGEACAGTRCAHPACWIEKVHVTELTRPAAQGPWR
jgi:hypothetical protein